MGEEGKKHKYFNVTHVKKKKTFESLCPSGTYLLIEEFTCLLLDGVDELYLSRRETNQQGYTLGRRSEVVEIVTRRLRPLVNALIYGLA